MKIKNMKQVKEHEGHGKLKGPGTVFEQGRCGQAADCGGVGTGHTA